MAEKSIRIFFIVVVIGLAGFFIFHEIRYQEFQALYMRILLAEKPRYHIETLEKEVYKIDTQTGEIWLLTPFSNELVFFPLRTVTVQEALNWNDYQSVLKGISKDFQDEKHLNRLTEIAK